MLDHCLVIDDMCGRFGDERGGSWPGHGGAGSDRGPTCRLPGAGAVPTPVPPWPSALPRVPSGGVPRAAAKQATLPTLPSQY